MYRKYTNKFGVPKRHIGKIWLIMRLTTVILIAAIMQVSAASFAQKISMSKKNESLKSVLRELRSQSGYNFVYTKAQLDNAKPVSINVKNTQFEEVLSQIFNEQPLTYSIDNKTVILIDKEKSFIDKVAARFQAIDVRGRVVGEKGEPLVGASILVKGGKGTTTDKDGIFYLTKVDDKAVLIVSFIGYLTKEVNSNSNLSVIKLEVSDSKLDEIHIIAYGTTSKRLSTNNTGGITAKDIQSQPVNNPLLALAGRIPGVIVTQQTGLPGSGLTVQIQGQNSISKGNDPFYVIDGSPYIGSMLPTLTAVLGGGGFSATGDTGSGNPFSFLNPSDIESIEVLKDADATAIYGSRAANGAILITTKKGKSGKTTTDITIQNGFGKVGHQLNLLNTEQYLMMRKQSYANDNVDIPTPTTGAKSTSNYDLTVWDQNRQTDWQKELIGGTSNYTDAQASISGGSILTTFRLNGGYHRETTVFPGDFSDVKESVGLNLNHTSSNQRFKIQLTANYLNDNNQLAGYDLTRDAVVSAPNAPALYNPDGTLNWERYERNPDDSVSTWVNPLGYLQGLYQVRSNNLISNVDISYMIAKGLIFKTNFGYSALTTKEYSTGPLTSFKPEERPFNDRSALYSDGSVINWIVEPQLTYNFYIGSSKFDLLAGTTFQKKNNDFVSYTGLGFNSDLALKDIKSASKVTVNDGRILSDYKYNAFFGRINYNLNNTYIVNLTARRDGSSRFGSENQFHNFGAMGAAWLFSNESFISDCLPSLSFGKLRVSYGTTGNDQIGDYAYLNLYDIVSGDVPYGGINGLTPKGHSNQYLQWELTKKLEAGVDLGFLKDRILFGINYFRNQSSNQLLDYSLPVITGFPGVVRNFPATVLNKGWEITLNTANIKNTEFIWNTSINLTVPINKLLDFPNLSTSTYKDRLVIGEPLSVQRVFSYTSVNSETGLYLFHTANGEVTDSPDPSLDNIALVNINPKFYGGFQNTFNYEGVELNVLFQFTKQKGLSYRMGPSTRIGGGIANEPIEVLERWQNPGDITDYQKFSRSNLVTNARISDLAYGDASFIRLKNVSVSWSLPEKWISKAKVQGCRLFVQGQNLITITKYLGLDPENQASLTLPPLQVMTFGLQVTL